MRRKSNVIECKKFAFLDFDLIAYLCKPQKLLQKLWEILELDGAFLSCFVLTKVKGRCNGMASMLYSFLLAKESTARSIIPVTGRRS